MKLAEQIDNDLISALKSKNDTASSTLRLLKSSIKNKEIALKKELTDWEIIEITIKEIKQRRDSIQQYLLGNRSDLAQKEQLEINQLEKYLPAQLSDQQLEKIVAKVIIKTQATSIKDLGKIMAEVMPKVRGKAEGSKISKIALSLLTSSN